jgi:pyruvate dehydrogenase E2 component (dihydrolipoamide acetyltransferase)
VLPLDRLQPGFCPVTLVWGKQDRTVPFSQSANAPAWFGLAAVEGAGHMLIEEAPHAVARAIVEQLQTI